MILRVGLPSPYGRLVEVAKGLAPKVPILLSANAFWNGGRFRWPPPSLFDGADVALDSAGFVAQRLYGGYRWSKEEYLHLAQSAPWSWWASMDFCCEPEVSTSSLETRQRQAATLQNYLSLSQRAKERRISAPLLPVLQGWKPADYKDHLSAYLDRGPLPELVGLGSVCRRPLDGATGLRAVLDALLPALPPSSHLHLFGVKGSALPHRAHLPAIASTDSQAWGVQARKEALALSVPCTVARRAEHLQRWYAHQTALLATPPPSQLAMWT